VEEILHQLSTSIQQRLLQAVKDNDVPRVNDLLRRVAETLSGHEIYDERFCINSVLEADVRRLL
jgi:hypothetical protein